MARTVTAYQVLIASPSDLESARTIAYESVLKWNELHFGQRQALLSPVMWETHSTPEMGKRPQAVLNEQIVDSSDIVIGMFWTRLGTATSESASGTVEEIERLIKAGRRASVYFCTERVDPRTFDQNEYNRVEAYRVDCKARGLLAEFGSVEDLKDQLLRHLTHHVEQLQLARGGENTVGVPVQTTAVESNAADVTVKAANTASEQAGKEGWFALVKRGKYKKGMASLREGHASGALKNEWGESEAFAQLMAYEEGGVYEAFQDLERTAKEFPDKFEVWFWYAVALKHAERFEEALAAMRHIVERGTGQIRQFAFNWLASELCEQGREREGLAVWRTALAGESNGRVRALYLSRMAQGYDTIAAIKNPARAHALYEYALETQPGDLERRLSVAFQYGVERNVHSLGLHHYLELLSRDPENLTARLNSGWLEDKLSLPISSVEHYKAAKAGGGLLAATNLGWQLLEAGFAKEAEDLVGEARSMDGDAALADKLAVAIRERREEEANRWKATNEKVEKVRKWRVRFAKALASETPSPESISGIYVGSPNPVLLGCDSEGQITGTFKLPGGQTASFGGILEGKAISLSWKTVPQPIGKGLLAQISAVPPMAGFGRFFLTAKGMQGITANGVESVDPLEMDTVIDWDLVRNTSSA
jgi:tetratricopeptide (TPR) repeat protein